MPNLFRKIRRIKIGTYKEHDFAQGWESLLHGSYEVHHCAVPQAGHRWNYISQLSDQMHVLWFHGPQRFLRVERVDHSILMRIAGSCDHPITDAYAAVCGAEGVLGVELVQGFSSDLPADGIDFESGGGGFGAVVRGFERMEHG
ncbi:hypothetical protein BU16DRAFT_91347 [Lophium mytilinum]|uniref:Uncharacterized protein n=1 Tax=Lophium mytilinum TaxID=390894 RepID=A0A6A6QLG1_9PEZI|nr:hypothetical protein BU16DRAFT_91347 [Lophium mytilinum]